MQERTVEGLPTFHDDLFELGDVESILASPAVDRVRLFVLGPRGTNIGQSAEAWTQRLGIVEKAELSYCDTPEHSVDLAKQVVHPREFPVFVTCAVYHDLHRLYFSNPECYPFVHHHYMRLDRMQLVAKHPSSKLPPDWTIATHPSPSPLLKSFPNPIRYATSNSKAAWMCASGEVNACITTEAARRAHGLHTLHTFGSPMMLFLFGTTSHGIAILNQNGRRAPARIQSNLGYPTRVLEGVK